MMLRLTTFLILFACLSYMNVVQAQSSDTKWYAGIGGGVSKLDPDMGDSGFQLTGDSDTALTLALGLDIGNRYSVELGTTKLGEAKLGENGTVSYQSIGISTVLHVLGNPSSIAKRRGLWGYARLGVNRIDNSGSSVNLTSSDSTAFQLGAGIEWTLSQQWSVRSELNQYDSDAQSATIALVWRNRQALSGPTPVLDSPKVDQPNPNPPKPAVTETAPVTPAPQPSAPKAAPPQPAGPPAAPVIIPGSRLSAEVGDCAVPAPGEPLNDQGCALFSGIADIAFIANTDQLDADSLAVITRLATGMLQYNAIKLEIGSHSVVPEGSAAALSLSRKRAVAVAKAFVAEGVPVSRLQARAFGDSVRRVAGADYLNPLNNRIVLSVISTE